jgi:hypothetical protein
MLRVIGFASAPEILALLIGLVLWIFVGALVVGLLH